ncbi:Sporulation related domain-containing protein [Janthinobacterium sp. OK676]|uniref:SPOR domain-containing protein n=1 Tax=unclassified Janthinobacterium TaxID=2610881 RepID=UPI00087E115D|nr:MULTISPECIES: SPOR domain-containing protein [unclassified Janthinobacterium]PJJ21167.1 sporulation related protein [Janthinobacterium sp. 67]SDN64391.1 Sporulation related domain-containing protein [Janthinobacterium sp. OK676]
MLKFVFWLLAGVNLLVLAIGQGYLGSFRTETREPARLKNQLQAGKLTLLTQEQATAPAAPPAADQAAKPAAAAPAAPTSYACTEVGNFLLADGRRFEAQVAALDLGDRQSRRNVAGQDISSYMVYIPPQGSKEGADRKAGELKQLGVTNYFIMNESSPLRWGISLGVFKSETSAQNQLASLNKQGVHSARVAPRYSASKQFAYQFRDLDAATRARLEKIKAQFPEQELRSCK